MDDFTFVVFVVAVVSLFIIICAPGRPEDDE